MGHIPKARVTGDGGFEAERYNLNLSASQLDDVARRLNIQGDDPFRETLTGPGVQPPDNQDVILTYKGRYVRITYNKGQAISIMPKDA
jgi:hypothetical protein